MASSPRPTVRLRVQAVTAFLEKYVEGLLAEAAPSAQGRETPKLPLVRLQPPGPLSGLWTQLDEDAAGLAARRWPQRLAPPVLLSVLAGGLVHAPEGLGFRV